MLKIIKNIKYSSSIILAIFLFTNFAYANKDITNIQLKPSVYVGKKGKSGLIGRAKNFTDALSEKERLYFAEHKIGNISAKSDGVTYEAAVPADHEVYFSISDSTIHRSPAMTLTHHGGVDIEDLPEDKIAVVPFDSLTGLKAFHVSNALVGLGAPTAIISPLVQNLPKLWDLYNNYGMTMLELNPIRMMPGKGGRYAPLACDFKCAFDQDDPAWKRLELPSHIFAEDNSEFEQEINQLRTYQGQSDVYVINDKGIIMAKPANFKDLTELRLW